MKVVLFCGGLGMRIREAGENIPKPMVHVGDRPILWHLMKYYAHFGHKDFILCLGYRGEAIKSYFVNYAEFLSNDFVLSNGGKELKVFNSDIQDWTITFVDTGAKSNIGQSLKAVERYLGDEEVFLGELQRQSNGLSSALISSSAFIEKIRQPPFSACAPRSAAITSHSSSDGLVQEIKSMEQSEMRINGGYFVFKRSIFDYINDGEELVHEPFRRLIASQTIARLIPTTASGKAWIRSKKSKNWTIWTARVSLRGACGSPKAMDMWAERLVRRGA